jgi:hypothetical protein
MWKTLAAVLTGISLVAPVLASAAEKTDPVQGPTDRTVHVMVLKGLLRHVEGEMETNPPVPFDYWELHAGGRIYYLDLRGNKLLELAERLVDRPVVVTGIPDPASPILGVNSLKLVLRPILRVTSLKLVLISASSPAVAEGEDTKLSLTTDYLCERIDVAKTPFGGHWLRLNVTLDNVGGGKGTSVIDPNSQGFNHFGDPKGVTEIATFSVDITVEAVKVEDPAQKGRRLYELKGSELETRLFLVVSPRDAGPSRLIVRGKDKDYVFPLTGGVLGGVKGDGARRPLDSSR